MSDPRKLRLPSRAEYVAGVQTGDRTVLSRAITLIESTLPEHQTLAQAVLLELLPATGRARRIGITGVPGVGKSTFIDALGTMLTAAGHKLAVLAVDPSSTRTGGSIMGDKTRMSRLAVDPNAYVRPSPTGGTLGGVAQMTRETMLLCEAAGYDVVLVETVGVGQSETMVAGMVDLFLALMLPGAGDELQGIKKGLLEIADLIAVNKADGDNSLRAQQAMVHYRAALRIIEPESACLAAQRLGRQRDHRCRAAGIVGGDGTASRGLAGGRRACGQAAAAAGGLDVVDARRAADGGACAATLQCAHCWPISSRRWRAGQLTPVLAVERILAAFGSGSA